RAGAGHPRAGTVRARHASVDRRRHGAADAGTALAGAPSDPDHARPARLLARLVDRRAHRHARPLSAPCLARKSARGRRYQPRQAARPLEFSALSYKSRVMSDFQRAPDFRQSQRLRLNTLIRLRWLAIVGQSITVLVVAYGL